MTSTRTPRSPADLGPVGRKFWRDTLADFELQAHELALLRAAARTIDRLEALAEGLVGADLTVTNARGDTVANPLATEHRQQSIVLARLLASLRMPTGDDDAQPQRRGGARGAYGVQAQR